MKVFLEEIGIWICKRSKEGYPQPHHWVSSNPLRAYRRKIRGKGEFVLCVIEDIHFLWPSDISNPGSEDCWLRVGLTGLAPMVLQPLGLDWMYILCRLQIMGLSLYHMSHYLIIDLFLHIHICVCSFLWRTLTNTDYYKFKKGIVSYLSFSVAAIRHNMVPCPTNTYPHSWGLLILFYFF